MAIPTDALPWNPPPIDAGMGPGRCEPGEVLEAPADVAVPCNTTVPSLGSPREASRTWYSNGCGSAVVDGSGTLLVHISRECGGYTTQDAYVLGPDLAWTNIMLGYYPLAFGAGPNGFLVADGNPDSLDQLATPVTGSYAAFSKVRVPFPLDFHLIGYGPGGYRGPFGAWPDDAGGLLLLSTGVQADGSVALGLAHVSADGTLAAGPIRVASTGNPFGSSLLIPYLAGVDGAGRMVVLWLDPNTCTQQTGIVSYAARWFAPDGTPLGDAFDVELDDVPFRFLRLADGSLALQTSWFGWWALRFADGRRGTGPVPDWLRGRDGQWIERVPGGFARTVHPCQYADHRAHVELLNASGGSCGSIDFPPISSCAPTGREGWLPGIYLGPDGTVASVDPKVGPDSGPGSCPYRVWPKLAIVNDAPISRSR